MDENVKDKAIKSPKRVFWELMLIGVALFAAGIFTLANPQGTLKFILIVLGVVSIVSSVGFFMRYLRIREEKGWLSSFVLVLAGLLFIFGIILIAKPDETWLFLIYAIGLWFIAYAVYSLISSVKYRSFSSKLFIVTFVLAILLLIAGVVLILSPTVGMTFIGVVIGIALIVNGLEFILLAIAEKLIDRRQKQSTSDAN